MKANRASRSTRFKAKALARWKWLSARGMGWTQAAEEIGVEEAELRAWSKDEDTPPKPLLVPVHVGDGAAQDVDRRLVAVLASGVRIEGLTLDDIVLLARRLS